MKILTPKELGFLFDTEFLSAKSIILKKIENLLKETESEIFNYLKTTPHSFPSETLLKSGKISRGENYEGFPYLILDYPRLNTTESLLLYRTMFWWGNFFSCTIHLKGKILKDLKDEILNSLEIFRSDEYLIFKGNNEWIHNLNDSSYTPINSLNKKEWGAIIESQSFLKISKRINLNSYPQLTQISLEILSKFTELLNRSKT